MCIDHTAALVDAWAMSVPAAQFRDCMLNCAGVASPRFALSELNSLLSSLTAGELRDAIAVPAWTRSIAPLAEPVFGSDLQSLRLYLLTHSPPAFRCRNIFIDTTVGDQV